MKKVLLFILTVIAAYVGFIVGAAPEPAHAIEEALYVGEVITDKNGKVLFGKEI